MEQQSVRLHETNEGRETQQGIAGFEGTNAFLFMIAVGLGMLFFRKMSEGQNPNMAMAAATSTMVRVRLAETTPRFSTPSPMQVASSTANSESKRADEAEIDSRDTNPSIRTTAI